jgi:protein-ribulosamine 3-kinase
MEDPIVISFIQEKVKTYFSTDDKITLSGVGGGCINQCYRLTVNDHQLFCKINSATKFPQLFLKEAEGLQRLKNSGTVITPEVIDHFESGEHQVLLLEWISDGVRTEQFWVCFAEHLAALHETSNRDFGLDVSNYMGSVKQSNHPDEDWCTFFVNERLSPLVKHCIAQGLLNSRHENQFTRIYAKLPDIFGKETKPSLVHGDLWSGNFMCNHNSEPVLIDPAVYFGHPAVDLGMTSLFGGFNQRFYEAYDYHRPFPPNHHEQWDICNLYPLLIHLVLFGKSYLQQIEKTLEQYV